MASRIQEGGGGMGSSRNNTYKKPSGAKVTVPSRNVNSKATTASETAMGKAQDTGKARGPLRGVARRTRDGKMADMTDAQMRAKYPSQDVVSKSIRSRARTTGKIVDGKLIPAKTVPIKVRNR